MDVQSKELKDYLVTLKKRRKGIAFIAATLLVISVIVAFMLPPVYRSSSTILIEQQDIPQELVMSTVTSYAAERIQIIQARVMSRANLLEIIEKFDLYTEERKYETTEEIIALVSDDISLDLVSANVVDPRTGRPSAATIAFKLSFESESPAKAQRVANELASLYLNENLRSRTQKAQQTSVFFKQESERLSQEIAELEKKLAEFKREHADALPDNIELIQSSLIRKESEVALIESKINGLEERRFYLQGQLASIDPSNPTVDNPRARLKAAETQYISMRARYSAEHPDVKRMEREIAALREETGTNNKDDIAKRLKQLRAEHEQVSAKYTSDHPDIKNLESSIALLEAQLREASRAEDEYYQGDPDNPAYITIKAQLSTVDSEIKVYRVQLETLRSDIQELQKVIAQSPEVEREYRALIRDYGNTVKLYEEAKTKQSRADVAKQLESESKGERFSLIDPPAVPEEPISPNRPAILFLGLMLSIITGIAYAFIADAISGSLRGSRQLATIVGLAPLAVIPYQENMSDVHRKKTVQKRTLLLSIIMIIGALLVIHFMVSPLDVLMFRISRKIDFFLS